MKRKIKASKKVSIRGKSKSLKMHKMIHWESTIERDFIKLFEYADDFVTLEAQPLEIEYIYNGKNYRYYPDFLVTTNENLKIVYEVKDSSKLTEERNLIKFQVGKKFCAENQMIYKVITEKEIRNGYFIDNLDLLIDVRENYNDILLHKSIINLLVEHKILTINRLMDMLSQNKGDIYEAIYQLIYFKYIKTDLVNSLLSEDSILEIA